MTVRFQVFLLMKINNMTKDKNIKTAIPELRFPEFEGNGDWEEKTLKEIGTITTGNTPKTSNLSNYGGDYLFVSPADISDKRYITQTKSTLSKKGYAETRQIKPYSILFVCIGSTIGKIAQNRIQCATNQQINSLTPFDSFIPDFIYSILEFNAPKIALSAGNHAVPIINKTLFSSIEILVPNSTKEQQKIAECLSSLDDLINSVADKIEALKDHKKGLMQKLFPAKGQTVPEFRFPEFEGDGEWKEKTLGKVATFINGRAYKQDELLECGKYRVLRVGNFFSNNKWYYSDLELNDNKFCDKGDLLYAWSASFGPRIWNEEKVIYHYHIWKVIENNNITKDFLYFLLSYETSKIKNHQANGLGLMHITKNSIENWNTFIPKDKKEQQKIADCLSTLDNEIEAQSNKLEELKAHKKGLMQKLFPKI